MSESETGMATGGATGGATARGQGVRAVDFVVYSVSDMERAAVFYRDTLGVDFPLVEDGTFWMEWDTPPVAFALCSSDGDWKGTPAVAFAVPDVYAAVEALRAKGVKILAEPEETGVCHMAFVEDPDGNRVCLHQRKDGTAG
ncbi:MAG TPA: VOC family protein [Chloroflexota bacterium]|nr:VOC family protein [Chloroflexota bacterium]